VDKCHCFSQVSALQERLINPGLLSILIFGLFLHVLFYCGTSSFFSTKIIDWLRWTSLKLPIFYVKDPIELNPVINCSCRLLTLYVMHRYGSPSLAMKDYQEFAQWFLPTFSGFLRKSLLTCIIFACILVAVNRVLY